MSYFPTITISQISDASDTGKAILALPATGGAVEFVTIDDVGGASSFSGPNSAALIAGVAVFTGTIDAVATPNIDVANGVVTGAN